MKPSMSNLDRHGMSDHLETTILCHRMSNVRAMVLYVVLLTVVTTTTQVHRAFRMKADQNTVHVPVYIQIHKSFRIKADRDTVPVPIYTQTHESFRMRKDDDIVPAIPIVYNSGNFSGVLARAFTPWPIDVPLPCFPSEVYWKSAQHLPATQGFLFLKTSKTASSTASGVNIRIARNVARRLQQQQQELINVSALDETIELCKCRFGHGQDYHPGYTLFHNVSQSESFLWTILRNPTSRATSWFFFEWVSRAKIVPSDMNFKNFLREREYIEDYYLRALDTRTNNFTRDEHDPIISANHILQHYNFIAITERFDESLVVLMMLLNLKIADILYVSAKTKGSFEAPYEEEHGKCTYIWPSFVSPGMEAYYASDEWKSTSVYDTLLYKAANRSLDMTIDAIGRDSFQANLVKFVAAQKLVTERCVPSVVFPCDEAGNPVREHDCLWFDCGCGTGCLDQLATDMDWW